MVKFIITTRSEFVHKYVLEAESAVDAQKLWHKMEEECNLDRKEISSDHLGENIESVKPATDSQIIQETDDYMRGFILDRLND